MSKHFYNNTKLFILSGILAGILTFSPVLSTLALAESAEVAGTNATTEATTTTEAATSTEAATTTESTATTESTSTTEASATAESATTTDAAATSEATTSTASTYDEGATIVRFYDPVVSRNIRLHLVVGAEGTQYNGNWYIPATISDDHKSFTFDGNIHRDGYRLVGYSSEIFSNEQRDNATPDQSAPYTVDANGFVHVNFADISSWAVTDDLGDDTMTYYYFFAPLWTPGSEPQPQPQPEPASEPAPEPQPASAPVAPASDTAQQPAPRREKSVLPNTGDASSVAGVVAAAGTALVALGLRKKMQQ